MRTTRTHRRTPLVLAAAAAALLAGALCPGSADAASVSTWDRVAACESGGNWTIVSSGSPTYYGGLQFSASTWAAYGGTQYAPQANQATKMQQILIAEKVLASQGEQAWPHCGPLAGLGSDHAVPYSSRAGTESGGAGRVRWADWDGDGKADYVIVNDDGSVRVFINKGGDGHGGWTDWGQVALGTTNDRTRIRFADFDGDGRADYITLAANGAVNVYLNKGGDGHGGWTDLGQVALGLVPDPDQVRFADFDGDGRTDYIVTQPSGAIGVYRNNGGDGHGGWTDLGQVALGVTNDRTRIRWADIDGDGRADYNILNPDGSITTYINHGGDTGSGWTLRSKITSGLTTDQNLVHLADITGDGRADYLLVNGPTNAFVNNGGDDQNTPGWIDYGQIALGA